MIKSKHMEFMSGAFMVCAAFAFKGGEHGKAAAYAIAYIAAGVVAWVMRDREDFEQGMKGARMYGEKMREALKR